MRTKRFMQITFCMLVITLAPLKAQESLQRFFEKCERLEFVKMNIVEQRNPDTKKITQRVTTVSFENHPELSDEFFAAFEKEKENATQVISQKRDNKIVPTFFSFTADGVTTSYSFSNGNKDKFSVTRIENGY